MSFVYPFLALAYDLVAPVGVLFQLLSFTIVNIFPGYALPFSDNTAFSWQRVVFLRESALEERFITGLEALVGPRTLGSLLRSDLFTVNRSLNTGSVVRVAATAYSSSRRQTDGNPFITASGQEVDSHVLAANFLPLGTQVQIEQRSYTVLDRMNPRYNGKYIVDVWMPTHEAAVLFGTRVVEMRVVSLPSSH
jgi:3D (Asp-Asp-Asp) domain-containing protein